MQIEIQKLLLSHYASVAQIYEQGIASGHATFATEAPSWQAWDKDHLQVGRLVAVVNNEVVGWASLSAVSGRCVYAGVAELSVYVASNMRGQSIGTRLVQEVILHSELADIWTLQAGVFPENRASLTMLQKLGFRQVGFRERIGKMHHTWRNTILLERRSKVVGIL